MSYASRVRIYQALTEQCERSRQDKSLPCCSAFISRTPDFARSTNISFVRVLALWVLLGGGFRKR